MEQQVFSWEFWFDLRVRVKGVQGAAEIGSEWAYFI
jgi:hypothetical protein